MMMHKRLKDVRLKEALRLFSSGQLEKLKGNVFETVCIEVTVTQTGGHTEYWLLPTDSPSSLHWPLVCTGLKTLAHKKGIYNNVLQFLKAILPDI